jgi:hypothetical protein
MAGVTRTFMEEKRWDPVVQRNAGVRLCFLSNSVTMMKCLLKKVYVTENDFKANLIKYITIPEYKNANTVLITPVARRKFNSSGHVVGTHECLFRDCALSSG